MIKIFIVTDIQLRNKSDLGSDERGWNSDNKTWSGDDALVDDVLAVVEVTTVVVVVVVVEDGVVVDNVAVVVENVVDVVATVDVVTTLQHLCSGTLSQRMIRQTVFFWNIFKNIFLENVLRQH